MRTLILAAAAFGAIAMSGSASAQGYGPYEGAYHGRGRQSDNSYAGPPAGPVTEQGGDFDNVLNPKVRNDRPRQRFYPYGY